MGALKAVVIISGAKPGGGELQISGSEHTMTLRFDPAAFTIQKDDDVTPKRVLVNIAGAVTSGLDARIMTLENGETAVVQTWTANAVPLYEAGQRTRQLVDMTPLNDNMIVKGPSGDGLIEGHTYTLIVSGSTGWTADLDTGDWKGDLPLGLTGAGNEKLVVVFVWTGGVPVVVAAYSGTVA